MTEPACNVRFTEIETGLEVQVESVFSWFDELERIHVVTYPTGRRYALTEEALNLHFKICTPQEVFIRAFGVTDRPTPKQQALELEAQHQESEPFLLPAGG